MRCTIKRCISVLIAASLGDASQTEEFRLRRRHLTLPVGLFNVPRSSRSPGRTRTTGPVSIKAPSPTRLETPSGRERRTAKAGRTTKRTGPETGPMRLGKLSFLTRPPVFSTPAWPFCRGGRKSQSRYRIWSVQNRSSRCSDLFRVANSSFEMPPTCSTVLTCF